jgi:hypothetical protein
VSPTLLTNTTLSYSRASNVQIGPDFPGNKAVGMNVPIMSKGDTLRLAVTNYFSSSYNALYRVPRNQYNLQHGWTWISGRHELDFGLDFLREQSILDQDFSPTAAPRSAPGSQGTTSWITCTANQAHSPKSRRFTTT